MKPLSFTPVLDAIKNEPELDVQALAVGSTPVCHFDLGRLSNRLETMRTAADQVGLQLAYSIKTNPSPEVLARVHAAGLLAEAINLAEVDLAVTNGWAPGDIVLNGPAKQWGAPTASEAPAGLHSSMCDCVEELTDWFTLARPPSNHLGLRLKAADSGSRFGVELTVAQQRQAVEQAVVRALDQGIPMALHFHANSIWRGLDWWLASLETTFSAARAIPGLADVTTCIDIGGGWNEPGMDALLVERQIEPIVATLRRWFPAVREFVAEPGEGLVAACGQVLARVVRAPQHGEQGLEIVVDASVAELPFRISEVRPVFHQPAGGPRRRISGGGGGVIHGRSCMERDLLAVNVDLSAVKKDDLVVFGDAGAYDVSLRTRFGSAHRSARVVFAG